jgi:hypothetical protein
MNVQLADSFQFIPFAVTAPEIIRGFFPPIMDDEGCLLCENLPRQHAMRLYL